MTECLAAPSDPSPPWHALPVDEVARLLDVEPSAGLSSMEAHRRLTNHGRNRLEEASREPRWRVFLRQFQGLLIIVLLVAAAVSHLVSRELETPLAIIVVVILNATIGFAQETRAEASLDAQRKISAATATARRDGLTVRLDAEELVPGDVIFVAAGDRVPADGRLLSATSLEVQESSLTGEAQSVGKAAHGVVAADSPLTERSTAVFMSPHLQPCRGGPSAAGAPAGDSTTRQLPVTGRRSRDGAAVAGPRRGALLRVRRAQLLTSPCRADRL